MKKVKIGLIGFGTIGKGVYDLLEKNSEIIKERSGFKFEIKSICDLNTNIIKEVTKKVNITDNWEDIINDKDIDLVIELIGGIEPAKTILINSLKNGKNVVTANKKLLAEEGDEIFMIANSVEQSIGFEAAVGGGIPCILSLKHGLVGNNIKSIHGILNGTTNYILTQMKETGANFDDMLKEAQKKGFAEADPTFDIEGYDAGHKIALLAMLAFNKKIDYKSIPIEGITKITDLDISYAENMGYVIKLLGIAKLIDNKLDIRVHPTMLSAKNPIAHIRNEFNAVMYDGDMTDPLLLYGKGAGSYPTASAVISDAVQLFEKIPINNTSFVTSGDAEYLKPEDRITRYYIRLITLDKPGILSKLTGVLGKNNISIATVIQKEAHEEQVPLIIMTHKAKESDMLQSINEIQNFDFIKKEIMLMRVEDSSNEGD